MKPRAGGPVRVLRAAAAVLLVAGAAFAGPQDSDPERAKLERAVHAVWLETEPDHARVRAAELDAQAASLAAPLAKLLGQERSALATGPERLAALRGIVARARSGTTWAVSTTTTALALDRAFPGALPAEAASDAASEGALAKSLAAALRALLAKPRFADCWDDGFLGLPEVRAWAIHSAKPQKPDVPVQPPDGNGGTDPVQPKPPGPGEPEPPVPPVPPVVDPESLLVVVEKSDAYTGPWTGWIDDLKKDNRRARRSGAKTVYIDRFEVTRAEYALFLSSVDVIRRKALLPTGWTVDDAGGAVPPPGPADVPVTGVTFVQASEYAASHGKRLPTEDEWERAAAGGAKEPRSFPWGDSAAGKSWASVATELKAPVPVTAYPDDSTPDGIVGMAGNVAEIVATQPDRKDVPAKLPEGEFLVVIRGGSYRSGESGCQTGARWKIDAREGEDHVGFRCVMDEAEYRRRFK